MSLEATVSVDREERATRELLVSYEKVFSSPDGEKVFADFVKFAQASDITEVRLLGRLYNIARILRQRQRAKESLQSAGVTARRSLSQASSETEQEN
jgi:hypothetical protein